MAEVEKGYNLVEVAQALGMQVITVRRWAQSGRIKAHQIPGSRRWIVLESELRRLQGKG